MIPVLMIGYGNPLRSDDAIGWLTAHAFAHAWPADEVRVEAAHQLLPEMAEWISQARHAVFVDACWDGVPGRLRSSAVHPAKHLWRSMTHQFSPAGLLTDAKQLYGHSPEARLFSMGGHFFEHGEGLSDQVAAARPELELQVRRWVEDKLRQQTVQRNAAHA